MALDAAAVKSLFSEIVSHASALNLFADVNGHAPESPPANGASYSVWLSDLSPVAAASGLAATAGRVEFTGHIYTRQRARPLDQIDPNVLLLACDLLGAYSGDFTLGGTVRDVELMAMSAQPAYVDFEGKPFRVVELTVPVVVNDMFAEVA